jgi:magnesium chelatase family protein
MLAKVISGALVGLDAVPVEVEVDIASQGLPSFTIVGLPDKAVEEAKERVRSAIKNSGADFPAKRITVNLAPADLPKEGPSYDLAIALGILLASGQIQTLAENMLVIGELALDGRLRPVSGALAQALLARSKKMESIIIPEQNIKEVSIVDEITILPCKTLRNLLQHLDNTSPISPGLHTKLEDYYEKEDTFDFDMKDVKGQHIAKRALEIAAMYSEKEYQIQRY